MSVSRSPLLSGRLFYNNSTGQLLIGAYSEINRALIGKERREERERRVLHALALECTLSGCASVSVLPYWKNGGGAAPSQRLWIVARVARVALGFLFQSVFSPLDC